MKVGLVTAYDLAVPGGVRTHILGLGQELQRRGIEVCVLGPSSREAPWGGDHALRFVRMGRPVAIPTAGSVARMGINPLTGLKVRRVLAAEGFDLLHLHEPFLPMAPFWSLVLSDAVKVGTFHLARDRPNKLYRYGRGLLRPLNHQLHGRIAVSEPARHTVARYLGGDYAIVPNGIGEAAFADGGRDQFKREPVILFVGRLERRKGLSDLLRAFVSVRKQVPLARLVVVGDGPLRASAETFVQRHGIDGVELRGRVQDEELPRLYREAAVFCAPSLENESFGIVLIEAMAAGTPVVASDLPGYRSVLVEGETGVIVPRGDVRALGEQLVRVLEDGALRERLGAAARERARRFSWAVVIDDVLAQYRLATERAGRSLPWPIAPSAEES